MLEFKEFTAEDYKAVSAFREVSPLKTCEISAGTLFMWRDFYCPSFCIYNDTLIIKRKDEGDSFVFFYPVGEDEDGALAQIEEYCDKNGKDLIFAGVEEDCLEKLRKRYNGLISYKTNRRWYDYIYDAQAFASFKGKKYSGQRNHINNFLSLYPNHKVGRFTAENIPSALALLDVYAEQKGISDKFALKELDKAKECTRLFETFGLSGIYVEVDGEMISYTLGEKCGKTHVIHIEKASRAYEGAYPFTANAYAKTVEETVEFINREDDAGDPGLRKSKLQYQPIELLKKYIVSVIRPEKRLVSVPTLFVNGVTASALTENDKQAYFELYTDEGLNKYWGYDYHEDIPTPSPDAFFNMVKRDGENKTGFSFGIHGEDGRLLGEAVVYDFRFGGSAEVGLRLFEFARGKGIARAVFKRVSDYCLYELGLKTLRARCFKQNKASEKMILSSGYVNVREDENMLYFIREE